MNNSATNKSLLVLQFNANGLKNHVNILQNVLYDKRIDIALITETHFTKYTHIFIPGSSNLILISYNNHIINKLSTTVGWLLTHVTP